jgi:hypothetical protein
LVIAIPIEKLIVLNFRIGFSTWIQVMYGDLPDYSLKLDSVTKFGKKKLLRVRHVLDSSGCSMPEPLDMCRLVPLANVDDLCKPEILVNGAIRR